MNDWTIAILPVLGIIVGAALHFWFSRTAEREKHTDALRSQAYVDYLRAVAAAGHLRSDEDLRDAHRDAADAKARIAVYGSASVIKALSRFEESGAILNNSSSTEAFVVLVSSMQSAGSAVPNHELKIVLLGTAQQGDEPSGTSRRR